MSVEIVQRRDDETKNLYWKRWGHLDFRNQIIRRQKKKII